MIHGRWETFRAVLFLAGLALVGYVAYRYTLFNPPDHGSLYGKIFPLALPFAALAMALALRPGLIARVPGQGGLALRAAVTAFGGVWMATGMMCVAAFTGAIAEVPLGGTFDLMHMLNDHLFLPITVVALAWAPERVARWMGAEQAEPRAVREPVWGAAAPLS